MPYLDDIVLGVISEGEERVAENKGVSTEAVRKTFDAVAGRLRSLYSDVERMPLRAAYRMFLSPETLCSLAEYLEKTTGEVFEFDPDYRLESLSPEEREKSMSIVDAVKNGAERWDDVAAATGMLRWEVLEYAARFGLPHPSYGRKYDDLEKFVQRGKYSAEIGRHYRVTGQMIRSAIAGRMLNFVWKDYQKAMGIKKRDLLEKQRTKERAAEEEKRGKIWELSGVLCRIGLLKAGDEGETTRQAFEKAMVYMHEKRNSGIRASVLIASLEKYYEARGRGMKLSLEEITPDSGLSPQTMGRILERFGEKPHYGTKDRHPLTEGQKLAVGRALKIAGKTRLSLGEMAWVIGVGPHVMTERARRSGLKREGKRMRWGGYGVRSAMELYEALDGGYTEREAMEYAGIKNERMLKMLVAGRKRIGREAGREVKKFKRMTGLDD